MITDLETMFKTGTMWPPQDGDTRARMELYANNENLFLGNHQSVWKDELRRLRGDKLSEIRLILNYFKRLSFLWSDLVCGQAPEVKAGDGRQAVQVVALDRIITENGFWSVISDTVIDISKFGDALLKVRFDKRGIIENLPPNYWYPIVDPANVKSVLVHVIAYEYSGPEAAPGVTVPVVVSARNTGISEEQAVVLEKGTAISTEKISYLKVEIHRIGSIENRIYKLKDGKIAGVEPLPIGILATQDTGLDDFAVIVIHNMTSTSKYHGMDDYSDIKGIIQELETRYAQIFRIEDKFASPSMFGPPLEEQDPRDGQYNVQKDESLYITVNDGQTAPGIIDPRGPPVTSYNTLDNLMQRLYEISETCKVAFDASAGGAALSAQALRLMLTAPLKKSNRLQTRLEPEIKRAIRLLSELEIAGGVKGAVEIPLITITWKDGLPQDSNADAHRDATLVTGKVRSAEGIMRDKGIPEDQILRETEEMNAGTANLNGVNLPNPTPGEPIPGD